MIGTICEREKQVKQENKIYNHRYNVETAQKLCHIHLEIFWRSQSMSVIQSLKGKMFFFFNAQTFCSVDELLSVNEMFNEQLPNNILYRQKTRYAYICGTDSDCFTKLNQQ